MLEAIVKAATIPQMTQSADPYVAPVERKNAIIVGGTHLKALSGLFPGYALKASVLIPSTIPLMDRELELERAIQFEDQYPQICTGVGSARDLSGIDTDSVDYLFICTLSPEIRDVFLSQSWRIMKEFGKLVVFTASEIPLTYLGRFGMAAPTYYPMEGFYVGTMRKIASVYSRN